MRSYKIYAKEMDDSKMIFLKKNSKTNRTYNSMLTYSTQRILITTTNNSILPANEQFDRIADNDNTHF